MNEKQIEVRFQYLEPAGERPKTVPYVTDVPLDWPAGWPLPRVGETLRQHCATGGQLDGRPLWVLAVHHDLARDAGNHRKPLGLTVTVTLGEIPQDRDSRLVDTRD